MRLAFSASVTLARHSRSGTKLDTFPFMASGLTSCVRSRSGFHARATRKVINGLSRRRPRHGALPSMGHLRGPRSARRQGHEGICQGEVKDGERRLADRMLALYGVFIDIESGDREADVRAKLLELGIAGVTYSTFSHNKPATKIKNRALMDYLKVQTLADSYRRRCAPLSYA